MHCHIRKQFLNMIWIKWNYKSAQVLVSSNISEFFSPLVKMTEKLSIQNFPQEILNVVEEHITCVNPPPF